MRCARDNFSIEIMDARERNENREPYGISVFYFGFSSLIDYILPHICYIIIGLPDPVESIRIVPN